MIAKNHNVNKAIITLPKEYFSSTCQRKIYKQSSMKIPNKVNPKPNKKISFDIKRYKKSTICFTNSFCQLLSEKANEFFICRTNYIKAKCPTEREKDFYDEDDISDFDLNEN